MKPNGTYFVTRRLWLLLCAVGLLAGFGSAQTLQGKFKLPVETHWGMVVLAPGEYEFTTDTGTRVVTVRSSDSRWTGMILAVSTSDVRDQSGSSLALAECESGLYVQALYLGDLSLKLNFAMPKGKLFRFVKSPTTVIASRSEAH